MALAIFNIINNKGEREKKRKSINTVGQCAQSQSALIVRLRGMVVAP